ncbi:hypothetical protein [Chitinivorax sp. B]|uniref:hypothetical protein n=1 Tax=Chitinivorax sp. B TaxID=2502235 RepID=UPI0010F6B1D6|nr:hypothetical protein [Chitinivorax sp. B]
MTRYLVILLSTLLTMAPTLAHEGHDHGAAPAASLPAVSKPRAEAQSDQFELVVVLEGDQLVLFLDRFADNQPVDKARIEVESGTWQAIASTMPDGTFSIKAPAFAKAGKYPLVFTITAGADSDLLETTLIVASPPPSVTGRGHRQPGWAAGWIGLGLLVLLGGVVTMRRRQKPVKG